MPSLRAASRILVVLIPAIMSACSGANGANQSRYYDPPSGWNVVGYTRAEPMTPVPEIWTFAHLDQSGSATDVVVAGVSAGEDLKTWVRSINSPSAAVAGGSGRFASNAPDGDDRDDLILQLDLILKRSMDGDSSSTVLPNGLQVLGDVDGSSASRLDSSMAMSEGTRCVEVNIYEPSKAFPFDTLPISVVDATGSAWAGTSVDSSGASLNVAWVLRDGTGIQIRSSDLATDELLSLVVDGELTNTAPQESPKPSCLLSER